MASIIPNIKIKVTGTEVNSVVEALSDIDTTNPSCWHRTTVSILESVMELFLKKQISKRHQQDSNPFKMEFKYYEAYFLKEYLLKYNALMDMHYLQTVIDKLDQKLA